MEKYGILPPVHRPISMQRHASEKSCACGEEENLTIMEIPTIQEGTEVMGDMEMIKISTEVMGDTEMMKIGTKIMGGMEMMKSGTKIMCGIEMMKNIEVPTIEKGTDMIVTPLINGRRILPARVTRPHGKGGSRQRAR